MRLSIWLWWNVLLEGYGIGMSGLSSTGVTMWWFMWTEAIVCNMVLGWGYSWFMRRKKNNAIQFFFSIFLQFIYLALPLSSLVMYAICVLLPDSDSYSSLFFCSTYIYTTSIIVFLICSLSLLCVVRRFSLKIYKVISFHQYQESKCLHPTWIIIVSSPCPSA